MPNRVCEQASPAVVTIKDGNGHGSGFLVSPDGLIITNAHVVDGSPSVVTVVFKDGKQVPADVIGFAMGGCKIPDFAEVVGNLIYHKTSQSW